MPSALASVLHLSSPFSVILVPFCMLVDSWDDRQYNFSFLRFVPLFFGFP